MHLRRIHRERVLGLCRGHALLPPQRVPLRAQQYRCLPAVQTRQLCPDRLFNPPEEGKRDKICTNATSVTVPIEAGAKLAQDIQDGSDEWATMYKHDRNTIEGVNGFLKDGAHEGIHIAERRRMRGSTAQILMIAMLVVTTNLRKLQKFRDEMRENPSVSRDDRDAAQLAMRKKRRESNLGQLRCQEQRGRPAGREEEGPTG